MSAQSIHGRDFLGMQIATGLRFVSLAQAATKNTAAARRREAARRVYDAIQLQLARFVLLTKPEMNQLEGELRKFKSELQKLA